MSNRYEIDLLDDDTPQEEGEGEAWMMSYLDVMTLLIAFFVLLLAMSEPKSEDTPKPDRESGGLADGDAMSAPSTTDRQETVISSAPTGDGLLDGSQSLLPASNSVVERISRPLAAGNQTVQAENTTETATGADADITQPGGLNQELTDIASTLSTIAELGIDANPGTQELTLRIDDNLLFFSGNAELRYAGMMLLKQLTPILTGFSGQLSIEGHTDDLPINTLQFPSNWELSSSRALAVLRFLDDDGLDPGKMRAVAYADSQPLSPNETREARARNRRVEIVLREADS